MQQNPTEAIEMCAPGESGGAEAEVPKAVPWLGFWQASRRRLPPDDPFFSAGDMERELLAKHVGTPLPHTHTCTRSRVHERVTGKIF
jgi:hypothetical protein